MQATTQVAQQSTSTKPTAGGGQQASGAAAAAAADDDGSPPAGQSAAASFDAIMALAQKRQQQHKARLEQTRATEAEQRQQQRKARREAIMRARARPARKSDPFTGVVPPMPPPEPPAAAAATANPKGGRGGGRAGGRGGGRAGGAPKKASTKLLSLQHQRPGEKPKGVKGWIRDLDARGWSKKKTALVRTAPHFTDADRAQRAATATATLPLPWLCPERPAHSRRRRLALGSCARPTCWACVCRATAHTSAAHPSAVCLRLSAARVWTVCRSRGMV